jgi:hypothetical protein
MQDEQIRTETASLKISFWLLHYLAVTMDSNVYRSGRIGISKTKTKVRVLGETS